MMNKYKLTKLEKYVHLSPKEYREVSEALRARRKDAVLNIRVNNGDLMLIKQKAKASGVKYQTFISEVLHIIAKRPDKHIRAAR